MGFILTFLNTVRKTKKNIQNLKNVVEDSSYALELVKQQIKSYLIGLMKGFFAEFLFYAIIVVVIIAAVGGIFQIFSSIGSEDFDSKNIAKEFEDKSIEEMQEIGKDLDEKSLRELEKWSESLTEEDIEAFQAFGASVHPNKAVKYMQIEDNSYQKNVNIFAPIETKVWENGKLVQDSIDYVDYELKRGDTAYPHRQWWHSTTVLDAVNDTASYKEKTEIVDNAERDLKPIFEWFDKKTPSYVSGDRYTKNSGHETEIITTTDIVKTYTLVGTSPHVNVSLPEDETPSTYTKTEVVSEYYPLPHLDTVNTMFADYQFEYKSSTGVSNSSVSEVDFFTITAEVTIDGKKQSVDFKYREDTTTSVKVTVNSVELKAAEKDYNERFLEFLFSHDIEVKSDSEMMLLMAELLPQNYDFMNEYEDYLSYMLLQDFYYEFNGDFGEYVGDGVLGWPVSSYYGLSSYFGYRIHPTLGVRKFHTGIDIPAPTGVDVLASEDGTVVLAGNNGTYGKTIIINHGSGITTLYAHNSALLVKVGQEVKRGDVIAKVGSTGRSTGPHLHFEVRKDGKAIDPLSWLNN